MHEGSLRTKERSSGAGPRERSRALSLIDATGYEALRPFPHLEQSNLALLAGDEEVRERELREALRLFAEMGATEHAERVARELGELDSG